jgi:hypothetical protein
VRQVFRIAVYISFIWNLVLVIGVVIESKFALPRATGGQFDSFPIAIRVLYVFTTIFVIYQFVISIRFLQKSIIEKLWILRILTIISIFSAVINFLSPSYLEKWNSIPALIIASLFFYQQRSHKWSNHV